MCTENTKNKKPVLLISIIAGIILTFTELSSVYTIANYIIEAYMRLLRFLSLPILFFSILANTSSICSTNNFKGIFKQLMVWSLVTTSLSAIIASLSCVIMQPASLALINNNSTESIDIFKHLIPDNMVQMFLSFNVIAIVLLGLIMGWATLHIDKESSEILIKISKALFEVFLYIARILISALPYIFWAFLLSIKTLLLEHYSAIINITSYVLTVLTANSLQGLIILPLILILKGINPLKTFRLAFKAIAVAFLTKSSAATLPLSMQICNEKLGMNKNFISMSLPLCTSINMNGCAAFIYITVYFVSYSQGIIWLWTDHIFWILMSVIAACGNAGVPMGCYFMSSAFLVLLGLPTDWMNIILPFYLILDMYETAINVWSDICVVSIVAKKHNLIEKK